MKIKKPMKPATKLKLDDTSEINERLNAAFDELGNVVVLRTAEIEAIKLAMLCKHHVLLNGPPGTGKSMLAKYAFRVVKDPALVTFAKQLMPGTVPEELFGPPNLKVLREQGVFKYNKEGMFPCCHFAFIDEVYRGPDLILQALQLGLNERVFVEGPVEHAMPLHTCVGTTNFISSDKVLEAFRDRWFLTCDVKPATTTEARMALLNAHLACEDFQPKSTIMLSELNALHRAIKKVSIPNDYLCAYEELVRRLTQQGLAGSTFSVSDRRMCHATMAIKAGIFIHQDQNDPPVNDIMAPALEVLISGCPDSARAAASTVFDAVIGDFEKGRKYRPKLAQIESMLNNALQRFDPSIPKDRMLRLKESVDSIITGLGEFLSEPLPADIKKSATTLKERSNELRREVHRVLNPAEATKSPFDEEVDEDSTRVMDALRRL